VNNREKRLQVFKNMFFDFLYLTRYYLETYCKHALDPLPEKDRQKTQRKLANDGRMWGLHHRQT
jgi:hypothetical protein